jgi:D-aspartate ligase
MLATPGSIVAQEWIEGPESNIYFTLFYRGEEGRVAGIFTGRKILCSPRDVGSTAVCTAAPEAREALESMTLAFADCAGFEGMGSMEYKWDDRHEKFVMVEPTVGRTDWQEEIATLCGMNIPLAAYRYELGLPFAPDSTRVAPVAWRASFTQRPPRHLLTSRTRVIDGYFRWDDPLPALQYYGADRVLGGLTRRWGARNKRANDGGNSTGRK